jgi:hypothetical protein
MLANYFRDAQVRSIADTLDGVVTDYTELLRVGKMLPLADHQQVIAKTHWLPQTAVTQEYREQTSKVVYLVRNPRDVILSSARMLNIPQARRGAFAKDFIAHRGVTLWSRNGWGTWQESVREWTSPVAEHQHFPGAEVLAVRYEDLRADPATGLGRIVDFLGLGGLDDKVRIERAVESASLAKMRELEQLERTRGVKAFVDAAPYDPFVGKGLTNQSLSGLGEDVEAAYRQWLDEDEEFRLFVKRFGYEA